MYSKQSYEPPLCTSALNLCGLVRGATAFGPLLLKLAREDLSATLARETRLLETQLTHLHVILHKDKRGGHINILNIVQKTFYQVHDKVKERPRRRFLKVEVDATSGSDKTKRPCIDILKRSG